jgi:hypothetical protein
MRVFSYLFHGLLTLFLLGISMVALSSSQPLQLEMLPWQGQTLTWWLLGAALVGLASVILEPGRIGDAGPRILFQPLLFRGSAGIPRCALLDRRRPRCRRRGVVSIAP